jgi:nicotinamide mononucleotide transporter
MAQLLVALRALSPYEAVAVVAGVIYVLLILRRNRWGWVAGAISSAIYVFLAAGAHLPMQSALNGYYVVMAVYGWFSWTRNAQEEAGRIHRWPLRKHVISALVIVAASIVSAHFLAAETGAAWPLLDSLTTWTSLVATWLVTRSVLENWVYWICADLVTVFLYAQQGHAFTACLFVTYMIIACFGLAAWLRRYRTQSP